MLTAPFAVVALGTHQGIMLRAVLGLVASVFMLPSRWRDILGSRVGWIGIPAALSIVPAAWLGAHIDGALIYLLVGVLVIIGLSVALLMQGTTEPITHRPAQILAGVGAGAGGVLAGIGGPALTIFGVLLRWSFALDAVCLQ